MKISEVRQTAFSLPFRRPLALSGREVPARHGVLVEVVAEDGRSGIGEAALHPAAGRDGLAAVRASVALASDSFVGARLTGLEGLLERCALIENAAARAGLETALYDLAGRVQQRRLAEFVGVIHHERIPVNALLDEIDLVRASEAALAAVRVGFTCLKLKAGEQNLAMLVERVRAVRDAAGPDVQIRIDANAAWTVAVAIDAIGRLAGFGIEYVEQPVPDLDGMAAVRREVGVPLAADEIVVDADSVDAVAEARAADVVIVKPAFLGLTAATSIARAAEKRGLDVVVTSVLDSSVGIAAALHFAATWGSPERASGLATASLLGGDLVTAPLLAERGELSLPSGPGHGVHLDRDALERWRITDG